MNKKNYFENRKKYGRHFDCRRFTVGVQAQVIRTLDAWSEVKKIQQAERNVVKGASLSVAKIFE